jgi:hypothetical protein
MEPEAPPVEEMPPPPDGEGNLVDDVLNMFGGKVVEEIDES